MDYCYFYPIVKINDVLKPKSLSSIRKDVPSRYQYAMIGEQLYDLNSGTIFQLFSNTAKNISTEDLFEKIINAFRSGDEIITWNEIYFGGFHYRDFIILNELFSPVQKWDVSFCNSIFNGETEIFEIQIVNITAEEHYIFCTKERSYKDLFLSEVKNLELVKLHLEFENLGGNYDSPSRFIDLVERAGWENGIKIIKALISVLRKMQLTGELGNKDINTHMSDRLQSDDHDIIYRFFPGNDGYQLIVRHLFEEDATSVRVLKDGIDEWKEEVFNW
jgi:hypothetical protein